MIVVVLLVLAGLVLIGVGLEQLREHAQRVDDRDHERDRRHRLMAELERLP